MLLWLWLLVFSSAALMASVLGKTVATAAGAGLGLAVLIGLTRNIPRFGKWMPDGLMSWALALLKDAENALPNTNVLVVSLAIILVFLVGSMVIFRHQEIQ